MGGKTSSASIYKYMVKAYDRVGLLLPKGRKAEVQARASESGESVNAYINRLIDEDLQRTKK